MIVEITHACARLLGCWNHARHMHTCTSPHHPYAVPMGLYQNPKTDQLRACATMSASMPTPTVNVPEGMRESVQALLQCPACKRCAQRHTRACTSTRKHAHAHTHARAHTHTCAHAHTHTHTHAHARAHTQHRGSYTRYSTPLKQGLFSSAWVHPSLSAGLRQHQATAPRSRCIQYSKPHQVAVATHDTCAHAHGTQTGTISKITCAHTHDRVWFHLEG